MPNDLSYPLVIAVSPRALLATDPVSGEMGHIPSLSIEQTPPSSRPSTPPAFLRPGPAHALAGKMLALNGRLQTAKVRNKPVEIVLVSEGGPLGTSRDLDRARASGLPLERMVATGGRPTSEVLPPLQAELFLSTDADKVRSVIRQGRGAAQVFLKSGRPADPHPNEVRIAFDFDGVLANDETERVFAERGLDATNEHETKHAAAPLPQGPLLAFAQKVRALQDDADLPARTESTMRLRTTVITSRAAPGNTRALHTLEHHKVMPDEAVFLGGAGKTPSLAAFQPDVFFDDQSGHIEDALAVTVVGHVPYGVRNADLTAEHQASARKSLEAARAEDAPQAAFPSQSGAMADA